MKFFISSLIGLFAFLYILIFIQILNLSFSPTSDVKTNTGLEYNQLAPTSELTRKDIFKHQFKDFETLKWFIDVNNMSEFIDGFDWLYHYLKIDKKDYRYEEAIADNIPLHSTMQHIYWTIANVDGFMDLSENDKQFLRMVLFFHDLGKAFGEPHEMYSERIARRILGSLDFTEKEIDEVCILVLLHNEIGKYPNRNKVMWKGKQYMYYELVQELNPNFLYYLCCINICDEKLRPSFDVYKRDVMRQKLYQTLVNKNPKEVYEITEKLDIIDYTIKDYFRWLININWDIGYRLKELFFEFDINKLKYLKVAV